MLILQNKNRELIKISTLSIINHMIHMSFFPFDEQYKNDAFMVFDSKFICLYICIRHDCLLASPSFTVLT